MVYGYVGQLLGVVYGMVKRRIHLAGATGLAVESRYGRRRWILRHWYYFGDDDAMSSALPGLGG